MTKRPRPPALLALALLGAGLAGCATTGAGRDRMQETERAIRDRGLDPERVVVPYQLSEEMRDWVHSEVSNIGSPEKRLRSLLVALFAREEGRLTYERGRTATAREVWSGGVANCLSFTHLFVGLAREIGLDVYYLRVADLQHFEKDGDLVVASEHVTAAYGPPTGRLILDFSEEAGFDYHQTQPLNDLGAIALFYSNLGATAIREGNNAKALDLLEESIRLDPELADGWVNYGVALRRDGRLEQAEAAFRRALEANPRLVPAYTNLAGLLERSGRVDEARRLLELTDRGNNRNPFSYLALGDLSMREARLEEAGRYFRRAQRLEPGNAEVLAALGQWALAAGRTDEARRWLRKARRIDPEAPRVGELGRSLDPTASDG